MFELRLLRGFYLWLEVLKTAETDLAVVSAVELASTPLLCLVLFFEALGVAGVPSHLLSDPLEARGLSGGVVFGVFFGF